MRKNYNYGRKKVFLPEYGRHIQEMVDTLLTIEDRHERNRQARAVIAVMGNLFPTLRDTSDFAHKLWDHLYIMSDFQLDVDSPYPRPTRGELTVGPKRMHYTQSRIRFKHYGKYVERLLGSLPRLATRGEAEQMAEDLALYMSAKVQEYNQEFPNPEVIANDIRLLSGGTMEIGEETINNLRSDYKQHLSQRPKNNRPNNQNRNHAQRNKNHAQRNHAKNNRPNNKPQN